MEKEKLLYSDPKTSEDASADAVGRINILMSATLWWRIEDAAKAHSISPSALVRLMAARWLKDNE